MRSFAYESKQFVVNFVCARSLGCRLSADTERNNCEKCTTCFPYGSRRRQCDLFWCMIVFIIFVLLLAQMENHFWTDEICISNATCESNIMSTMLHLTPNIQQKLAELQFIHRANVRFVVEINAKKIDLNIMNERWIEYIMKTSLKL